MTGVRLPLCVTLKGREGFACLQGQSQAFRLRRTRANARRNAYALQGRSPCEPKNEPPRRNGGESNGSLPRRARVGYSPRCQTNCIELPRRPAKDFSARCARFFGSQGLCPAARGARSGAFDKSSLTHAMPRKIAAFTRWFIAILHCGFPAAPPYFWWNSSSPFGPPLAPASPDACACW